MARKETIGLQEGRGFTRLVFIGAFASLLYEICLSFNKKFQIYSPELDSMSVSWSIAFESFAKITYVPFPDSMQEPLNVDTLIDGLIDNM